MSKYGNAPTRSVQVFSTRRPVLTVQVKASPHPLTQGRRGRALFNPLHQLFEEGRAHPVHHLEDEQLEDPLPDPGGESAGAAGLRKRRRGNPEGTDSRQVLSASRPRVAPAPVGRGGMTFKTRRGIKPFRTRSESSRAHGSAIPRPLVRRVSGCSWIEPPSLFPGAKTTPWPRSIGVL